MASAPRILLSTKALKKNLQYLIEKSGGRAALPVIKANAYGLGAVGVAQTLEKIFSEEKLPFFCVARIAEANELANAKIKRPLLLLSERVTDFSSLPKNCHVIVASLDDLTFALKQKKLRPIHIKFNTGMNRLGISVDQLTSDKEYRLHFEELVHCAKKKCVAIAGISSHLACGDEETSFNGEQLQKFQRGLQFFADAWDGLPEWVHLANSAGVLRGIGLEESRINAFRPGIHLWGVQEETNSVPLIQTVVKITAPLRQIETIESGASIGYGRQYVAQESLRVGIVNYGYADGLRRDSWKSPLQFSFKGQALPFLGVVSMDLCAVNLSSLSENEIKVGDELEWIGPHQSVENVAQAWNTIPYEVFTSMAARMERIWKP